MPNVAVLLADGFETIEALAVVDVLRRAGIRTRTVSTMSSGQVISAQQVQVNADERLDACDTSSLDCVVIPGGLPATRRMRSDERVCELIRFCLATRIVGASGTAPALLADLSLLDDRRVSAFPGYEAIIAPQNRSSHLVVCDRNLVTAGLVSSALPFSVALVRLIAGEEAAKKVCASIGMQASSGQAIYESLAAGLPAPEDSSRLS